MLYTSNYLFICFVNREGVKEPTFNVKSKQRTSLLVLLKKIWALYICSCKTNFIQLSHTTIICITSSDFWSNSQTIQFQNYVYSSISCNRLYVLLAMFARNLVLNPVKSSGYPASLVWLPGSVWSLFALIFIISAFSIT